MLVTLAIIAFGLGGIVWGHYHRELWKVSMRKCEHWKGRFHDRERRAEQMWRSAEYWKAAALEEEQRCIELEDQLEATRWQLARTRGFGPVRTMGDDPCGCGKAKPVVSERKVPRHYAD